MHKKRLLIVCAPFGFGPASQSITLTHKLKDEYEVVIFSSRDAYQFILAHKPEGAHCVHGLFSETYPFREALESFCGFICINHAPAVKHLAQLGLAERTIFFDNILTWRLAEEPLEHTEHFLAYLVQDYPGVKSKLDSITAQQVALTAPILWSGVQKPQREVGFLIHFGGVTSPLAEWEAMKPGLEHYTKVIQALANRHNLPVTVIGSAHLKTMEIESESVHILGSVDPATAVSLISNAKVLITNAGIGAIYEAIDHDVPIFMLPPFASTQIDHFRVFNECGIQGTATEAINSAFINETRALSWQDQTRHCLALLNSKNSELTSELILSLADPISENTTQYQQILDSQRKIGDQLSKNNPYETILNLLNSKCGKAIEFKPSPQILPQSKQQLSLTQQYFLGLPKIELHVHLEGSINPDRIARIAKRNNVKIPFETASEFNKLLDLQSFDDFINLFLIGVNCLQKPIDFYEIVLDMASGFVRHSTFYVEVTWTPQLYLDRAISLDAILNAINQARIEAKNRWGVEIRWIPDLVRNHPGPAMKVTEWICGLDFEESGIVALGLGGPEAGNPARNLEKCFQLARDAGLPANPHSGEGAGPESIRETLQLLNPRRIGHGVRAVEDPDLLRELAERQVVLEVCPSSNVQLKYYKNLTIHPLEKLVNAGCQVSINTDDPVLFNTNISAEYYRAHKYCNVNLSTMRSMIVNSAEATYLSPEAKNMLQEKINNRFNQIDAMASDVILN